jgi:hypothetical protein
VQDDACLRDRLRWDEESDRTETTALLRHEIVAGKHPVEREHRPAFVRRIIANAVQLADVLKHTVEHHRAGLVGGIGDDVPARIAPFFLKKHRESAAQA